MSIELKPISPSSGAYEAGLKFESETQPGNIERPVVKVGNTITTEPLAHEYAGTLGALDAELDISSDGHDGTAVFQVLGTWKGKIVVEGSVDGTYNNLSIVQPGGAISFAGVNNDNQNGVYRVLLIAGYTKLRLRMSAYTSGAALIVATSTPLIPTAFVWQLNQANLLATAYQGGTWNIANVSGTVSLPTGAATLAEQQTQSANLQAINPLSSVIFDTILITYTDATKATIQKVEWKLGGAVVKTLTPTFAAQTDTWVKS